MPIKRHRQPRLSLALLLKTKQGRGVNDWIRAEFKGNIVAAEFALLAKTIAQPPYSRVKEEECLHQSLQEVPQIISPADMCKLVGEDNLKLLRC